MYRQIRTQSSGELRQKTIEHLLAVILIGLVIGTILMAKRPDAAEWTSRLWNHGFSETLAQRNVLSVFSNAFLPTAGLLLLCLIMGFCAIGQPCLLGILLWRGVALGIAVSGTYHVQGLRGLPAVMFLQLPHALGSSLVLTLAVREAMRFSNQFLRFAWTDCAQDGIRPQLRLYVLKFAVLCLILCGFAVVDSILTYCLTDLLLMA